MPEQSPARTLPLLRRLVVVVLAATLVTSGQVPALADDDPRLERAKAQRVEAQASLDEVLQREQRLAAEVEDARADLEALVAREEQERAAGAAARGRVAEQIRASYRFGSTDPTLALIASDSPEEAIEQARLLALLASHSRRELEAVGASRVRTAAAAGDSAEAVEVLRQREAELAATREEAATLVAEAERKVASVREQIAREEEERRRREEEARRRAAAAAARRAAQERASRSQAAAPAAAAVSTGGGAEPEAEPVSDAAPAAPAAPAPVGGGVACPVGSPRNYSDSWGASRSGGRAHKGTDILSPHGTPIYAYESGTITRLNNSSLGGISLYLAGDSGNVYYYTHLSGYAGVSAGQRVSAGQHVAYNGDSGNAAGVPHLHFEVMPGGGGNVNPYPYVLRACG